MQERKEQSGDRFSAEFHEQISRLIAGYCVSQDAAFKELCLKNIRLALTMGVNPNKLMFNDSPALFYAITANKSDLVSLLLEHKADPNWTDPIFGDTLLYTACLWKRLECIKLLVQHGANPNLPANKLMGPRLIALAAEENREDIVRLVMEKGVDINGLGPKNITVLEHEIEQKNLAAVTILLKCGARMTDIKKLSDFLATCDQSNPDTILSLDIVMRENLRRYQYKVNALSLFSHPIHDAKQSQPICDNLSNKSFALKDIDPLLNCALFTELPTGLTDDDADATPKLR